MYPLRDSQLKNYIENNRAWKYEESAWHVLIMMIILVCKVNQLHIVII
jgi:hypothetical protein